jgi:sugar-specific transcriptional regulator TrmB
MQEFKFPDEVENTNIEVDDGAGIEIEIEDDTPERDRGRKPLSHEVADPTDEEIESYSDKVKNRIKELTHARHDERRTKEAVLREKQELERLAQQLIAENKHLKTNVNRSQEAVVEAAKQKAEAELDKARRKLREAQESFNTDDIMYHQEAVMDAKLKLEQVKNYRPTPLQDDDFAVQTQQSAPQADKPDEKSLRWQAKNQWFGSPGFEEYTSYALGLHKKLVTSGISPSSDEYFEQINARVKSAFPELFGETEKKSSATAAKKPSTVVASASRSTATGKIKLTTTQMALAKKFGLTPQQYAAQVMKLEA